MPPIRVTRSLYLPSPRHGMAPGLHRAYLGPSGRIIEKLSYEVSDEVAEGMRQRFSDDHGRTWSDWELLEQTWPRQIDCTKEEYPFCYGYDPAADRTLAMVFQRIVIGDPRKCYERLWQGTVLFYDHGFVQTSGDEGRTWGPLQQLRYEPGPTFDPANWGHGGYLSSNQLYGGYSVAALSNGTVVYPGTVRVRYDDPEDLRVCGSLYNFGCQANIVFALVAFVGRWDPATGEYGWVGSRPLFVPRRVSTRGLMEPAIVELRGDRALIVARGSNAGLDPLTCPGRAWLATSADGGLTWSDVSDLRYDTGERFYSPSAMSRLIRSGATGRLYWVGNISPTPPRGNEPRYPLVIAEVNEDRETPALRKETVTVIDDRDPARDSERVQFSNFALTEDRRTGDLEVFMGRYGEKANPDGTNYQTTDLYRYAVSL